MCQQYYLVTEIPESHNIGLTEVCFRKNTNYEKIFDVYRIDRLIKIKNNSILYQICCDILEVEEIFIKYCQVIKQELYLFLTYLEVDRDNYNKSLCLAKILTTVIVFIILRRVIGERVEISPIEINILKGIKNNSLCFHNDRLQNSEHVCTRFYQYLQSSIN